MIDFQFKIDIYLTFLAMVCLVNTLTSQLYAAIFLI